MASSSKSAAQNPNIPGTSPSSKAEERNPLVPYRSTSKARKDEDVVTSSTLSVFFGGLANAASLHLE